MRAEMRPTHGMRENGVLNIKPGAPKAKGMRQADSRGDHGRSGAESVNPTSMDKTNNGMGRRTKADQDEGAGKASGAGRIRQACRNDQEGRAGRMAGYKKADGTGGQATRQRNAQ